MIAQHETVQEVCVFGVANAHWGETGKALVVRRPRKDARAAGLIAWSRGQLAAYKRPRYIQFIAAEDLPRSTTV